MSRNINNHAAFSALQQAIDSVWSLVLPLIDLKEEAMFLSATQGRSYEDMKMNQIAPPPVSGPWLGIAKHERLTLREVKEARIIVN